MLLGKSAPGGTVIAQDDSAYDLENAFDGHHAAIVFYRGFWCIYCVDQLRELDERRAEYDDRDITLLAIVADPARVNANLAESLSLTFPLYSDPDLSMIRSWGVEDIGVEIALPATFLVKDGGEVIYEQVGADRMERASIDDVLAAFDAEMQ